MILMQTQWIQWMYRCRFVQVVAQQIGGLGFEVHAVYALLSLSVAHCKGIADSHVSSVPG